MGKCKEKDKAYRQGRKKPGGKECEMAEKKRMANMELLRMAAMVMVVAMHFLAKSGNLPVVGEALTPQRTIGALIEAFCLVAVNVYVLISGFFGLKGSFRVSKAISFLCQIWFYSLLIPLFLGGLKAFGILDAALFIEKAGEIYGLSQYLLPIETEHYWFATSYFLLLLLSPVLKAGAKRLSKRQFQILLGGLLLFFSVIKSICPVPLSFDRYGYDLPWFICLYLTGLYLGKYGWKSLEKSRKKGFLLYALCCFPGYLINLGMWALAGKIDGAAYYFTVPYHYNFILCLLGAVGLFYGFYGIGIREGRGAELCRQMGGLCFGVYLLHEHIDLRDQWYGWLQTLLGTGGKEGAGVFAGEFLASICLLFGAGILIDYLRKKLFAAVSNSLSQSGISHRIRKLDEVMAEKEEDH